ncbi:MAG: ERCC4 domain-containing protein [Nitrososphaeria archaeon]
MSYVIVDHRESKSLVPSLLKELGVKVHFKHLEIGDYIISPEVAVERKTLSDFASSLFDGRLFVQVDNLTSNYSSPFLIVEGNYKDLEKYIHNPKVIYGTIISLLLNFKVNLINVLSEKETALVISSLINKIPNKYSPPVKHLKKKAFFDQQVYIVSSLPKVGRLIAIRLLERFGSPKNIFLASTQELSTVKGLGIKRARTIRSLLDTPWNRYENYFEKISK